jgi:hypothetical protein
MYRMIRSLEPVSFSATDTMLFALAFALSCSAVLGASPRMYDGDAKHWDPVLGAKLACAANVTRLLNRTRAEVMDCAKDWASRKVPYCQCSGGPPSECE